MRCCHAAATGNLPNSRSRQCCKFLHIDSRPTLEAKCRSPSAQHLGSTLFPSPKESPMVGHNSLFASDIHRTSIARSADLQPPIFQNDRNPARAGANCEARDSRQHSKRSSPFPQTRQTPFQLRRRSRAAGVSLPAATQSAELKIVYTRQTFPCRPTPLARGARTIVLAQAGREDTAAARYQRPLELEICRFLPGANFKRSRRIS